MSPARTKEPARTKSPAVKPPSRPAARAVARPSPGALLPPVAPPVPPVAPPSEEARFAEVIGLIEKARGRAFQAVNTELVSLYWQLGRTISDKIASSEWGDGVVDELAAALARRSLERAASRGETSSGCGSSTRRTGR